MALRTAFTELLSLRHPIALAPMSGACGGASAAAVSNGSGLGLVGGGADPGLVAGEFADPDVPTGVPAWGAVVVPHGAVPGLAAGQPGGPSCLRGDEQ